MQQSDVLILGSGFFGVTTAYLLSKKGVSVTLISQESEILSSLNHSLNVFWPSLNDPPTRTHVAHGEEVASYLNDFCSHGIDFFHSLFSLEKVSCSAPCLRVGLQEFEQEELIKAQKLGFGLTQTEEKSIFTEKNNTLLFTEPQLVQDKALHIKETQTQCTVTTKENSYESEIVVLGNNLFIGNLYPKYKNILVPMSDILTHYECHSEHTWPSVTFRAFNGHVAASFTQNKNNVVTLKVTGPRFMLPGAGVGVELKKELLNQKTLDDIKKFHHQIFKILSLYFKFSSVEEFLKKCPFQQKDFFVTTDCHPCDELPLVGEFGKLGKVLGCTGFLATGFPAGVWGAKIIHDLILTEKSENLHPRLKPRRFYKIN